MLFIGSRIFTTNILNAQQLFYVSDDEGYVNVRQSPSVQSDVLFKLPDKYIVEQIPENDNNWIKIRGGLVLEYSEHGSVSKYSEEGYIHRSRLVPLSERLMDSIRTAKDKFLSNDPLLRPVYVFQKDMPHIIFFSGNDCVNGWSCELSLRDLLQGKEFYYTNVPVCAHIHIESDTLWVSEHGWMGGSYDNDNYGIIADYKMIKKGNTFDMVCTRFYPTVPEMSKEEIEKALNYKRLEEELTDEQYAGVGIRCYRLFVAYCNGSEEAKSILTNRNNFNLDGGSYHEYSDVMSLLDAYESNLNWEAKKNRLKDGYE